MEAACALGGCALEGGVAVAVVGGAFLFIAEDIVGLADFFEFVFGGFVAGVFVRVEFYREFAVGFFDIVGAGVFFDAEHFVVVPFGHGGEGVCGRTLVGSGVGSGRAAAEDDGGGSEETVAEFVAFAGLGDDGSFRERVVGLLGDGVVEVGVEGTGDGDFFDAFHQLDQRVLMLRQHGSKADAAISANRCGHAMREARVEPVIPEELAVIMGVDVDKAGGDDGASCVNFLARCTGDRADFNDQAVLDRHVSGIARCARAINDGAAANDHIVHVCVPGLRSECDIMHTTGIGANAIRTRHIFAAFITRDPFAKIFR